MREGAPTVTKTKTKQQAYELFLQVHEARYRRAMEGDVVIDGDSIPVEKASQGTLKWYLNSQDFGEPDARSAVQDWDVFSHYEIEVHTGKHTHQGGLVIYVLDGEGYTIVEDRRVDWEAGDLLLLPITPGGVEHQHFNKTKDRPARWIAFIHRPMQDALGSLVVQIENVNQ